MRTTTFALALMLSVPAVAAAQEWADYQNNADGFKITMPGQPTVSNTTWTSEHGYTLPGHVYRVDRGNEHYVITVIDYRAIEQQGIERARQCQPPANICTGNDNTGPGFWKHDARGGTIYASHKFMQRDAKLTDFVWAQHDRVEGVELQLTNPDQSRTFAFITMHDMRLYMAEATIPKGGPPGTLLQTSVSFVDAAGTPLAYQHLYANEFHGMGIYPPPPRGAVPRGGAERGGGAGARGGGGRGGNAQQP
jgi:hypothetical protein